MNFTTPYTQTREYTVLMALEIPEQKERQRTAGPIFVGVSIAAFVMTIGFAMTLTTSHLASSTKQCRQIAVKMFDDNSVPKYFIGPGYKITPVSPSVTDAMINVCR